MSIYLRFNIDSFKRSLAYSSRIFLVGFLLCESPVFAQAAAPSNKSSRSQLDLEIVMEGFPREDSYNDQQLKFQTACTEFAKHFAGNKGLWGTGPFNKVSCISDVKTPAPRARSWRLLITGDDSQKKFEISFVEPSGKMSSESVFQMKTEVSPIVLMSRKKSAAIIAAHLSMGLPFRSTVNQKLVKNESMLTLPGLIMKELPAPESPIQVFSLGRTKSIWQPKVLAVGERNEDKPTVLDYKISVPDSDALIAKTSKGKSGVFYIQQAENRDEDRKRLEIALTQDVGGFLRNLFGVVRSAYVGGRYGQPIGKATGILAKAPLVGMFGEFRGGLLQGLKFNYDLIPIQKYTTDEVSQEFSWSRIQFGYGFGRKFNGLLFNWIDLTPKLGVTNLVLKQDPNDALGDPGFEFKLHRAPTFGAEVGVEKRTPYFLARMWTYASYSLGVIQLDKNYKSTSVRVGLDLYRDLFALGSIKVALLGFAAGDSTSFSKAATASQLEENPDTVTTVNFKSLFAGAGLTLTW